VGTWFSQNMNWGLIGFTKLTVFLRYLQYHGVFTAERRQKVEVRYCYRTRETPSAGIVLCGIETSCLTIRSEASMICKVARVSLLIILLRHITNVCKGECTYQTLEASSQTKSR
jgi:hypothetical protein